MRGLLLCLSLLGFITVAATSEAGMSVKNAQSDQSIQSNQSFKLAGIYWLPDYLKDNSDRNKRLDTDNGGKDIDRTCAKYNSSWVTSVPADMQCESVRPLANLTCYRNCHCVNVVTVGTGEQCNRYCNGNQCVSKSCKPGVSVAAGETCTERCASNSNICTAKRCAATVSVGTGENCTATCGGNCVAKSCKAAVSVATGETCTQRCASNNNICTAKSCNTTVTVGNGEQCTTTCGGNCVAKSCKGSVTVGTGEQCTQKCASNSGICTAKSCKTTATLNTGEYCTERCAADNSCTAKACKGAVSVGAGETCTEHCASNTNTCTDKSCKGAVTIGIGEVCSEYCASNSGVCTAKKCNTAVTVSGTEVCTQTCASNSSVCTAKRNKTCAEGGYYASQPSGYVCTAFSYAGSTCYKDCSNNSQLCINKGYAKSISCDNYEGLYEETCAEDSTYKKCKQDCNRFYNESVDKIDAFNKAINYGRIYYARCGKYNRYQCGESVSFQGKYYKSFNGNNYAYICGTVYKSMVNLSKKLVNLCNKPSVAVYSCPPTTYACNSYGNMAGSGELIIGPEACCARCTGSGTPNGMDIGNVETTIPGGGDYNPVVPTGTGDSGSGGPV